MISSWGESRRLSIIEKKISSRTLSLSLSPHKESFYSVGMDRVESGNIFCIIRERVILSTVREGAELPM